ncbi:undecaprenyl-phosphate glucose phosphotransferase [Uliginosibacterium sp. H3]|uniref:Undecaprenyl-phosphate glucose phosphotransferase n=1 Tax=Uliginosibacterium silvisoli TaxID=3114758 RepID=A0ABU6K8K0_9RHOO|nr:undecaprenyl-phosphate glucose phosphotransferase [Uliginosibacterium sp. H3]
MQEVTFGGQTFDGFLRGRLTLATSIELFLDPLIIVCSIFIVAAWLGQPLEAHHISLALIALLATFPGSLRLRDTGWRMAWRAAGEWLLIVAMLLLFGYASGYIDYFTSSFITGWVSTSMAGILVAHEVARRVLPTVLQHAHVCNAVIVGGNDLGITLSRQFIDNQYLGVKFAGFFDDREAERLTNIGDARLLGSLKNLATYVKANRVDHIYIALPMASQPRILSLLDDMRDTTASIFFVPDIFMTDLIQGRVDSINGMPVVAVCETPFTGVRGVIKRASDIVLSSLILLAISPVFAAVAFGVYRSSPGPIIFAQRRYGLDGREIIVYKFRSMSVTEDGDKKYTQVTRGDPRVTPFGNFIRKTSLDELPQFINVLQGRMSIVGPRPHAISVNEQYRKLIPGYMVRHKVKPGITGWAQVNGYRGGDDLDHMKMRIKYDLEYLRNWSLRLDLLIILRTVKLVAKDSKAF